MILSVAQAFENEIIKKEDVELSYLQILKNTILLEAFVQTSDQADFLVGGKVIPDPLGSSGLVVQPLCCVGKSLMLPLFSDTLSPLIPLPEIDQQLFISGEHFDITLKAILQAQVIFESTDPEQRAFFDSSLGVAHYRTVDTRLIYTIDYQIKVAELGVITAPNTDDYFAKLAELDIHVSATDIQITNINCDIFNVTAQEVGDKNKDWTNEKTRTIYLGGLDELKTQFFREHTEEGEHRERVIHASNIDIGIGKDQLNARLIPIGKRLNDDINKWKATENVADALQKEITIRQALRTEFDINREDFLSVKKQFHKEHTEEGEHRERVIHASNIDIGIGRDQLNALLIPIGKKLNDDNDEWKVTENVTDALQKEITIRQALLNEKAPLIKKVLYTENVISFNFTTTTIGRLHIWTNPVTSVTIGDSDDGIIATILQFKTGANTITPTLAGDRWVEKPFKLIPNRWYEIIYLGGLANVRCPTTTEYDFMVIFSGLSANGSSAATTSQLTLTFTEVITNLTLSDIGLSGVSGVVKGSLSQSGLNYTLGISGFSANGNLTVTVAKSKYTFTNPSRTVQIYYKDQLRSEYGTATTWTAPNNLATSQPITFTLVGGGGGGGGGASAENASGGGGGSGYQAQKSVYNTTVGTQFKFTVGSGGAGGTGSDNGSDGGSTSMTGGTTLTAQGGKGGVGAKKKTENAGGSGLCDGGNGWGNNTDRSGNDGSSSPTSSTYFSVGNGGDGGLKDSGLTSMVFAGGGGGGAGTLLPGAVSGSAGDGERKGNNGGYGGKGGTGVGAGGGGAGEPSTALTTISGGKGRSGGYYISYYYIVY